MDEGDDDLRRALARLERREKHRRDGSSMALIDLDAAGEVLRWNLTAEQIFGWSEAEMLGRDCAALMPEAGRVGLSRGGRQGRVVNVRKDGRRIVCEWSATVWREDDVEETHCEVRDVSEAEAQRQRQRFMQALADRSPLGIFAKRPDGRYLYANEEFARSVGRSPDEIVDRDDFAIFDKDIAAELRGHDAALLAADVPMTREDAGVGPDSDRTYWSLKFPLRDEAGELMAICGIVNDITTLRRGEQERTALQQRMIESQREALAELSTPLIPVAEGVLVMPLIGDIDERRAAQIMEALLAGVVKQRARTVIIDITGVPGVGTQVARTLIRAAEGTRLLGAEAILTGINPEVARTLVQLGVDLAGLVTIGSLRGAVARTLKRQN